MGLQWSTGFRILRSTTLILLNRDIDIENIGSLFILFKGKMRVTVVFFRKCKKIIRE